MKLWRHTLEGVEIAPRRARDLRDGVETARVLTRESARALLDRVASNPLHVQQLRSALGRRFGQDVLSHRTDDEVLDELAFRLERGSLRAEIDRFTLAAPLGRAEPEEDAKATPTDKVDHDVEFEIIDDFGDPFSDVKYTLTYPDGVKKEGTLGSDGRVKETSVPEGTYRLALKLLSSPRWSASKIVVGEAVKLVASAGAFPEGTSGSFDIHDYRGLHGDKLTSVDGQVSSSGNLEGEWTPSDEDAKAVSSGKVVFLAKIEKATALSSRVPLLVKREFELKDDQGPLADTTMTACFTSGYQTTVPVKGGKAQILVRAGDTLAWLDLPGHPGAYLEVEEEGGAPRRELYLPDASDSDAPAPEAQDNG